MSLLLLLVPLADASHGRGYRPPPEGEVIVTNRSGGTVTVALTGQPGVPLAPWTTAVLHGPMGESTVRATYVQLGSTRTLQSDHVHLDPRRDAFVMLQAEDEARVLVTNDLPFEAELFANDQYRARLAPGASRVLTVPVGMVDLVVSANGRTLDRTSMRVAPFADHRWIVEPREGDLVVVNPLPIPIELVAARGSVRTVPAGGRVVYEDVPAGSFSLTARRVTDERIDSGSFEIRPGRTTEWRIDAPSRGLVAIDNEHWLATRVTIDGQLVRTLTPDADARIELALGWHRFEVRDERGHVLTDTWIEVEPYDVARLDFGIDRHSTADAGDDRDDDERHRDEHDRGDHAHCDHDRDDHGHGSRSSSHR